jgi:hypothetical protein
VIGFFYSYRNQYPVSRNVLHEIADQFHKWVVNRSQKWDAAILEAPEGRRVDFVDRYFRRAQPDQVVAILKAREPARIMIAIGNKKENRWPLEIAQRWVIQYNFYVNDKQWGRNCPRLPLPAVFRARVPEPASLARESPQAGRNRLSAMLECISKLQRPETLATTG